MNEDIRSNPLLGSTARWTAAARGQESARADHLFVDPWASQLAGAEGAAWLEQRGGLVSAMVVRTHYFDGFLQRAMAAGETSLSEIRQVVIMAAGLDTRAYRLDWPEGTRLYELDQAEVLEAKEQVLSQVGAHPTCARFSVAADLTGGWQPALLGFGFDPASPTVWLLEGFLFYLENPAIAKVLDEVSALSAPGSRMGFDIINSVTLTSPWTKAWIEMQAQAGAPWIGCIDDPVAFLGARGWQASLTQPGAPDANFDRWKLPVIPVLAPDMPHNWYVTAVK